MILVKVLLRFNFLTILLPQSSLSEILPLASNAFGDTRRVLSHAEGLTTHVMALFDFISLTRQERL